LSSIKIKLFGSACHTSVVEEPGAPVLKGFSSNNVPGPPSSGTKLAMKAEIRRVLSVPVWLLRMLAETFQFGSLVRPALCTGGLSVPLVTKLMTAES